MHKISYALWALPLMLLGTVAQAQTAGTITFTANKTSATGSLTPVLTWSTTPVATSCAASGAWSGTKFASGSETVAQITTSKSYTLTCSWGNGTATVNWSIPTQNADGSALKDLAGFKVVFGNSATALSQSKSISDPKATSTTLPALASGNWYFAVRAVNSAQVESPNSNVAQKTIAAANAAKSVDITITAATPPPPPTPPPTTTLKLKTISTRVYDILMQSDGSRLLGRQIGTIAIGKPCGETYKVGTDYYRVNRDYVNVTRTPRSSSVVVRCAKS
jgi:hypothetical protein